jgi:DNA/RNA endonuclease YhcR with UshA esterase domain
MKTTLVLCSLLLISHLTISAQEPKPEAPAAAPTLATVDPANVDDLRAHEGQDVIVKGKVNKTKDYDGKGQPGKGINFISLEGGHFTMIVFESDYGNFPAAKPASLYKGKEIEITGTLEARKGAWQIKVSKPEQVKIIESKDKKDDKKKKSDKADPHD